VARASLGGDTTRQVSGERISSPATVLPRLQKFRETAVTEAERRYLMDLLSVTEGDIQKACQISGLSRSRLYALLKKHRLYPSG
jgi:two-component system NtrC family response regulator